jgi:hypothetical protein
MSGEVALEIVPGATHLFEEPGRLERVAATAARWFSRYSRAAGVGADRSSSSMGRPGV